MRRDAYRAVNFAWTVFSRRPAPTRLTPLAIFRMLIRTPLFRARVLGYRCDRFEKEGSRYRSNETK